MNLPHLPDLPETPAELVEYYRQLDDYCADRAASLPAPDTEVTDETRRIIRFLPAEQSLVTLGLAPVDTEQAAEQFRAIVDLLAANSPDNKLAAGLQALLADGEAPSSWWEGALHAVEKRFVDWAEAHQLDSDSVLQLVHWALSPFWRAAAQRHKSELQALVTNERPTCPICGKHADIAILDDRQHGRRFLHCFCCNWQWPFRRMGCSYCGNTDYAQLGYLLLDKLDGYKVYHCEACKSYLKTFDRRDEGQRLDSSLLLEGIKTLFVDRLAIEKGYLPLHGQGEEQ